MAINERLSLIVEACADKRAEDIVALDMERVSLIADYFVICHGNNERQVQAIARGVKEAAEELNIDVQRLEGFEQARWILVDMNGIVCHIFHKEERSYYNLERLWGDAIHIDISKEIGPI